jgi:hypothetical protein
MDIKIKYLLLILLIILTIILIIVLIKKSKEKFKYNLKDPKSDSCYDLTLNNINPTDIRLYDTTFLYHRYPFVLSVAKIGNFKMYQECSTNLSSPHFYFLNLDNTQSYMKNIANRTVGTFRLKDNENVDGYKHTNRILILKPSEVTDSNDPKYKNFLWEYSFTIHWTQFNFDTGASYEREFSDTIQGRLNNDMFKLDGNSDYIIYTQTYEGNVYKFSDSDFDKRYISININDFIEEDQPKIKNLINDTDIIKNYIPDPQTISKPDSQPSDKKGPSFSNWLSTALYMVDFVPNLVKSFGPENQDKLSSLTIPLKLQRLVSFGWALSTAIGVINIISQVIPDQTPQKLVYGPNSYYSMHPPYAGINTQPFIFNCTLVDARNIDDYQSKIPINYNDEFFISAFEFKNNEKGEKERFYLSCLNTTSANDNPIIWAYMLDSDIKTKDLNDPYLKPFKFKFYNLDNLDDKGPVRICNRSTGLFSTYTNSFIHINNPLEAVYKPDKYYWPISVTCREDETITKELCKCIDTNQIVKNYLKTAQLNSKENLDGITPFIILDALYPPENRTSDYLNDVIWKRLLNYQDRCNLPCNGGETYGCTQFGSCEQIVKGNIQRPIENTKYQTPFNPKCCPDNQNCAIDINNNILCCPLTKRFKKDNGQYLCCNDNQLLFNSTCVNCKNDEDFLKNFDNLELNTQYTMKILDKNNNIISFNFDDNQINTYDYKIIINNDYTIIFSRSLLFAKLLPLNCIIPEKIGSFIKIDNNKYKGQLYILGIQEGIIGIDNLNRITRNNTNPVVFNITPTNNLNEYNLIITKN